MKWSTHEVENQVPELGDYNLYESDPALREAVAREGASAREHEFIEYGAWLGTAEAAELARQANANPPWAERFDRRGFRVDKVHFHPAWHVFMGKAFSWGMHCGAWSSAEPGPQVARAAFYLLHGQIEAGTLCPLTMTSAAIPLLGREVLYESLRPLLFSRVYDPSDSPLQAKKSMLVGMGMTEKQGGSDLRSTTTRAIPLGKGGRGADYSLIGHKWFFSVPNSDAHLVLAQHEEQHSCFYVPRWQPDGSLNRVHIQRLKDKLGNRSNASAEVEFVEAYGVLVGEPGRGIATLVEMASLTRLDCVLGSTALMRQALVQALHHASHRKAFGKRLAEQPLMRAVLADLALESEAATTLALRLARAFEGEGPLDLAYRRILTPAAKFWICKRAVGLTAECMEVWGGNGYVEDGPMPRLFREAPVNAIWEGSGNVMCLDVLRGLRREPELAGALIDALVSESSDEPLLSQRAELLATLASADEATQQGCARHIAQWLVLLVQANLLRRHAPSEVADAFLKSRFGGPTLALHGLADHAEAAPALLRRAWYE
ncbi:isovaleryl-CoA dehydrogenase [Pusillimonas noertemannii]|uniref:isovaleryl-CoA dehydrogenase n=1 Tax=Pusillimonas noertemannii TaxID=305977 RepID=UPI000308D754|nr:isovaleryl-CoA dehydrogenase [Pusillimonas noertemannii]